MSSSAVGIGRNISLNFNTGDLNDQLFVRAKVKDPTNTLLQTVTLSWDGEAYSANFMMPDLDFIKVDYESFEDSGFTVPSCYENVSDVFYKNVGSGGGGSDADTIEVELEVSSPMVALDITTGLAELNVSSTSLDLDIKSDTIDLELETNEVVLEVETIDIEIEINDCVCS